MKLIKTKAIFLAAGLIALPLSGCSQNAAENSNNDTTLTGNPKENPAAFTFKKDPVTVNAFKLDTFISISAYEDIDESYLYDTLALCDRYEEMFSMHKEGGALYNLNEGTTDKVPSELGRVMETALKWSQSSDGAFQISVGRVTELWDFTSGSHVIPSDNEIKSALKTVDDTKISLSPSDSEEGAAYTVSMPEGTKIDLGAVAKGYIADKLKEDLISRGITSAVINLGGNVLCVGDKNGDPFNIGIRKPFAGDTDMITVLKLKDCSAVSSGISERYFEENGRIYHHIINPRTGYPYENELWQSTVITKDSLTGDILSTLCYALGTDKALELAKNTPDTEVILVKDDLSLVTSDGANDLMK